MNVAVVGAGTAGSATTLLLARAGHAVTLFERVAEPRPVGAGITLQPTGQAVMAHLGLLPAIEACATRVDGLLCQRPNGKPVVDLRYADVDPRLYGLGLHRGVLFETLLDAVKAQAGATLFTGVEIVDAKGVVSAVTPRAPRRWDATTSTYVAWDGLIADGTSLTVGYRLSAPSSSGAGSYQVRVIAEAVLADGTVVASDVTKLIDVPLSPMVMT